MRFVTWDAFVLHPMHSAIVRRPRYARRTMEYSKANNFSTYANRNIQHKVKQTELYPHTPSTTQTKCQLYSYPNNLNQLMLSLVLHNPFNPRTTSVMLHELVSHSTIPTPTSRGLHRTNDLPPKVLKDIRNIADRVAVRKEVPAAGAVAVVVEPGAEDEVGSGREEEAINPLVNRPHEKSESVEQGLT